MHSIKEILHSPEMRRLMPDGMDFLIRQSERQPVAQSKTTMTAANIANCDGSTANEAGSDTFDLPKNFVLTSAARSNKVTFETKEKGALQRAGR